MLEILGGKALVVNYMYLKGAEWLLHIKRLFKVAAGLFNTIWIFFYFEYSMDLFTGVVLFKKHSKIYPILVFFHFER